MDIGLAAKAVDQRITIRIGGADLMAEGPAGGYAGRQCVIDDGSLVAVTHAHHEGLARR